MGRVFATKGFDRWSKNHDVEDAALAEAIDLTDQGVVAAQLGGGLVKLHIARNEGGKSGGYRTIVALNVGERAIYLHGFAKNDMDNIDSRDLFQLKQYGKALQNWTMRGSTRRWRRGSFERLNDKEMKKGEITTHYVMGNPDELRRKHIVKKPSGVTVTRVDLSEEEALAYQTSISATVHEGMEGLFDLGLVTEEEMRDTDASCLVPVDEIQFPDIAGLRKRENISQSILAHYLGVATATVSQWERGLRKPDGPVLKLLSLVERNGLDYIR